MEETARGQVAGLCVCGWVYGWVLSVQRLKKEIIIDGFILRQRAREIFYSHEVNWEKISFNASTDTSRFPLKGQTKDGVRKLCSNS